MCILVRFDGCEWRESSEISATFHFKGMGSRNRQKDRRKVVSDNLGYLLIPHDELKCKPFLYIFWVVCMAGQPVILASDYDS